MEVVNTVKRDTRVGVEGKDSGSCSSKTEEPSLCTRRNVYPHFGCVYVCLKVVFGHALYMLLECCSTSVYTSLHKTSNGGNKHTWRQAECFLLLSYPECQAVGRGNS